MKLVCFSNNTAGGLVCDLLNNKQNLTDGYKTNGVEHNAFKIGDTESILTKVNYLQWQDRINIYKMQDLWFGTHLHPSGVPDLTLFDQVIVITTNTRASMLYRWLRYYYGWFRLKYPNWIEDDTLTSIDKIRELAKNVFIPFESYKNCENVEFSDIVEGRFIISKNLNLDYFNRWQKNNPWLYFPEKFSWAIDRFNEAEYEITYKISFKYI